MSLPSSSIVLGRELARKLADCLIENDSTFDFVVVDKQKEKYAFNYSSDEASFVKRIYNDNKWLGEIIV